MSDAPKTLSPRALADAVGVSESSIRRWVDDGLIDVIRTAGGHRRITVPSAVRFVRGQKMRLFRPEVLGLPELNDVPEGVAEGPLTADLLYHLVVDGETLRARAAIVNAYLGGSSLAELFDGPVSGVLQRLGTLYEHDERGIYLEHVATAVSIEAISQLRGLMTPPPPGAPSAVGAAPSDDPYILPSLSAAAALADLGYREVNLGAHTPTAALVHAVEDHEPRLVWLAVTSSLGDSQVRRIREELLVPLTERGIAMVVGGHASGEVAEMLSEAHVVPSLTALADIAADLFAKS